MKWWNLTNILMKSKRRSDSKLNVRIVVTKHIPLSWTEGTHVVKEICQILYEGIND